MNTRSFILPGKRLLLGLLLLTLLQGSLSAQPPATKTPPPYLRFKTIPPFELRGLNGELIVRDQLAKKDGTIIMFFSPDCHHCITQVEWMQKEIKQFSRYNLVLATYQPMETLVAFFRKYNLTEWKNLYIGRDEKFFLPTYFRITNLPFIATYDKKGALLKGFEGNVTVENILSTFR